MRYSIHKTRGQRPGPNRRPFLGFTLVELLVVVAIIALLMAILLPSLQGARESAKRVSCMSNHKQLLLAIRMYAEDNMGHLPYPKASFPTFSFNGVTKPTTPSVSNPVWIHWYSAPFVGQYFGNTAWPNGSSNKVIYCPSLNVAGMMKLPSWDSNNNSNGIGLNFMWNCGMWRDKGGTTPLNAIRSPSRYVLLSDAAGKGYKAGTLSWDIITRETNGLPYDSNGVLKANEWVSMNAYRHSKTCVLGFADGHVSSYADVINANKSGEITTISTK